MRVELQAEAWNHFHDVRTPDGGVIDDHLDSQRCFQPGDTMGTVGNFMAGWFFAGSGSTDHRLWRSVCLVSPTEYPSAADWESIALGSGKCYLHEVRWLHEKSKQVCGWEYELNYLVWTSLPSTPLAFGYFAAEKPISFPVPSEALHFMPRQRALEMHKVFHPFFQSPLLPN